MQPPTIANMSIQRVVLIRFVCSLVFVANAFAADVTYFRADGGIARATEPLPDRFDAPNVLRWRVSVDSGHSTPAVCGGRVFLTTFRSDGPELATLALDRLSGKELWKRVAPIQHLETFHRTTGNPAAATPACDGERVYVFFGSYGLICYDLDGRIVWQQPLGPFQDEFGASSSPVLIDGKLILCEDHDLDSFLLALDARTGRTLWKVARPDAVRSYSTPAVWNHDGRKELLVAGALELAGYDPEAGKKLWWVEGLARIVIPVPTINGETIFTASWTPGGDPGKRLALDSWATALSKWDTNHDGKLTRSEIHDPEVLDRFFRMDLDQSGDLDQKEWERHAEVFRRAENAALALKPSGRGDLTSHALVWKHQRGAPYVASPLVHKGVFWMVKDGGIVTKLDAASGDLLQEERLPEAMGGYYASPVAGDGKVFFASELGVVSILGEEREWRVVSSHAFQQKIYATPVLDHGCVFLRTDQALCCFGMPGRAQ
jgi:outer membrane protein assembly factor BamB